MNHIQCPLLLVVESRRDLRTVFGDHSTPKVAQSFDFKRTVGSAFKLAFNFYSRVSFFLFSDNNFIAILGLPKNIRAPIRLWLYLSLAACYGQASSFIFFVPPYALPHHHPSSADVPCWITVYARVSLASPSASSERTICSFNDIIPFTVSLTSNS